MGDKQSGLGAKRKVTMQHDGFSLIEGITEWQDGRGYKVRVSETASPLKSMQAELGVNQMDEGLSEIYWSVDFDVKGGPFDWLMGTLMMKPIMKGVLKKNVSGLAYYSATGKTIAGELPSTKELTAAIRPSFG